MLRIAAVSIRVQAQGRQAHPVLGHGVGQVHPCPLRVQVQRWGERQDVALAGFPEGGQRQFGQQEGSTDVDVLHEVVPLHVHGVCAGQVYGRGVVYHDVDAPETLDGGGDRCGDVVIIADVPHQRQGLAAGGDQLLGSRKDRAFEFRVRIAGLGHQDDVGAVARRAGGDGQPDAAASA